MKKSVIIAIVAVIIIAGAGIAVFEYYGNMGTLSISVADLPASNVSAVYISFSSISIHSNSSGWTNYSLPTRVVNIYGLTLNNSSFLGNITTPSGKYTMIRVYVTSVNVVVVGFNETFKLASRAAFLNHPFSIAPHSTTGFTMEFDLHQCLNLSAKIFTPYIGIVTS